MAHAALSFRIRFTSGNIVAYCASRAQGRTVLRWYISLRARLDRFGRGRGGTIGTSDTTHAGVKFGPTLAAKHRPALSVRELVEYLDKGTLVNILNHVVVDMRPIGLHVFVDLKARIEKGFREI